MSESEILHLANPAVEAELDERAAMGRTAGWLWLLAALVALGGLVMPGTSHDHSAWVVGIGAYGLIYSLACLTGRIPWATAPMWQHIGAVVMMAPLLGLMFWATGGEDSYAMPLAVLPLFFIAYFYPARLAWPLMGLLVGVLATPLLYDADAVGDGYVAQFLATAAAFLALTAVVLGLKRQLLKAERRQRVLAMCDSLTGLANRRAFDVALQEEVVRAGDIVSEDSASALLFLDLDRFKDVNDAFGHPAGDRLLKAVAARCAEAVRLGDTFARIGGDEFAVVAPRAGLEGAGRLARDLEEAVADAAPPSDAASTTATVSFSLFGRDGRNAAELMRAADRRLQEAKASVRARS